MWFPVSCARCTTPGSSPCARCLGALTAAPRLPCPPELDELAALVAYDEASRPFVTAAKYRNARTALTSLAPAAAAVLGAPSPGLVVTWAPTSAERRRARGFDQAQLLAGAVAAELGCPVRHLLRREGGTHQTGRSRAERLEGPEFRVGGRVPADVVIVDDVCTTGATLSAAARALRAVGAHRVRGLVLARTPDPSVRGHGGGGGPTVGPSPVAPAGSRGRR
jgi:predicted amidophosphoribosyltransferase